MEKQVSWDTLQEYHIKHGIKTRKEEQRLVVVGNDELLPSVLIVKPTTPAKSASWSTSFRGFIRL